MTTAAHATAPPPLTQPRDTSLSAVSLPRDTSLPSDTSPRDDRSRPNLPTLPALVAGRVTHSRSERIRRVFAHDVYQWLVDVDVLPEQPWYLKPFASFSAADHLGDPTASISANVRHFLALHDIRLGQTSRILMLANARVLGHVFDPLSVFWCLDPSGAVVAIVAEVHNTYGERHVYLLRPDASGVANADKAFHVSPFLDVSGRYEMRFELSPEVVSTTVILRKGGGHPAPVFTATFRGHPTPASPAALAGQLARRPLMPQQVSALIRMHGVWLWLRRLPVLRRPHHQPQKGV